MNKNNLPLVSILIPAYNKTKYLKFSLESAINQTYENIEIIICDDSTNTEVETLVREYMLKFNKIRYYNNGGPLGRHGIINYEKCLDLAQGEYISYLFDDDEYYQTKIEKMVNLFIKDNSISLITSSRTLINENGDIIEKYDSPFDSDIKISGEEIARKILFSIHNFIGEPTTIMFRRKDVINDTIRLSDYYNSKMNFLIDIPVFLKLCAKGNVFYIKEHLSKFRIHSNQNTQNYMLKVWSPIDFLNLIIDSYENGLFIYNKEELNIALDSWKRAYSFMIQSTFDICKKSEENKNEFEQFINKLKKYDIKFLNI